MVFNGVTSIVHVLREPFTVSWWFFRSKTNQ